MGDRPSVQVGEEYHDFVVIGAGICGMYQLIKLRDYIKEMEGMLVDTTV